MNYVRILISWDYFRNWTSGWLCDSLVDYLSCNLIKWVRKVANLIDLEFHLKSLINLHQTGQYRWNYFIHFLNYYLDSFINFQEFAAKWSIFFFLSELYFVYHLVAYFQRTKLKPHLHRYRNSEFVHFAPKFTWGYPLM